MVSSRPIALLLAVAISLSGLTAIGEEMPYTNDASAHLTRLAKEHRHATLHELGESPGGRPLTLLQLGARGEEMPGVLVVANMTGDAPLATEAALRLADSLAGPWAAVTDDLTWYIQPLGNPDGYASLFDAPLVEQFRNDRPHNDDLDLATDEDGPDDLNGDGLVTIIRQLHPEGTHVAVPDRPYLVDVEPGRDDGDRYRLFSEGIDNDGDGLLNEDGPGGVNPGHNFPHRFQLHTDHAGLWPASEPEARELMRFAFARPSIAMVIVFGRSNTLRHVPDSDRNADISGEKFPVPGWLARRAGVKRGTRMALGEMLPIVRDALDRPTLSAESLLGWLSDDAETQPHPLDLAYWTELAEQYTARLDSVGLDGERLDSPPPVPGSVEEWAYYQYGVPTFALDFWTPPVPAEDAADSSDADSDTSESEPRLVAEHEALLAYRDDAWLDWTAYNHPTLGPVEIGGMRPFAALSPLPGDIDRLLNAQLPVVLDLADALPQLAISRVEVTERAAGVYQLDAWISNTGFLPTPTHHGKRTRRPVPTVALLEGVSSADLLEGRSRTPLGLLEGNGGSERVRWVIAGDPGDSVTLVAHSPSAGRDSRTVRLEGGAR